MPARLAQILVARGVLPPERASEALHQMARVGGGLDTLVLEHGWAKEPQVLAALAEASGIRPVNLGDFEPNPEVAALIPPKIAERLNVVPLSVDGSVLHVACGYPVRKGELDEVAFLLGKQLELWVGVEVRIRDWISAIYKVPLPARFGALMAQIDPTRPAPAPKPAAPKQAAPAPKGRLVEDVTLEDSLTHEMVERLAQSVADEPIPLEVRKRSAPPPPPSERKTDPELRMLPEFAPQERAKTQPELRAPTAPAPPAPPPQQPIQAEPPPPAAPEPAPDEVPEWTLAQARAALKEAAASGDREQLMDVALKFSRRTFDFAAAFAIIRGAAVGWDGRGDGLGQQQVAQVSIPLDSPSVFRSVALSRGSFTGPPPPDALSRHFLSLLGRQPRAMFLYPVEVKARLVAILYGDSGPKPISQRRLSDLILFCADLPSAFQEVIFRRKQRAGMAEPLTPEALAAGLDVEVEIEPAAAKAPAGLGWSPFSQASPGRAGRTASMPGMVVAGGELPPSDFGPLLRRLTGPDATERARAMAELARSPEASSKVLAQNFPGPTAWSRLPVVELPEADELGPIPGALSRLGRSAAQALAPLLDSPDSDTRYLALLTAGNLPFAELVDGVLRGLFDLEPDISSAARAAAAALRRLPRFDSSMRELRQELTSRDPIRRSLAARALGVLHDRDAIDGLVGLTGSDDGMTAQAAAEALREITRQNFGLNPRQWLAWWAENRSRRRVEWLVAALRHPDLDLRMSAIEELTRVLNDSLGYAPEAQPDERELAVRRWEAFIAQAGRGQRLEM